MVMTKADRVLAQFERRDVDYLPSQITFSDRTRDKQISEMLGLDSEDQLDAYLENHIQWTFVKDDVPLFYRNDMATIEQLKKEGFATMSKEDKTVYDRWGMGILIGSDGFYSNYGPLMQNKELNDKARDYLSPHLQKLLDMDLKSAIEAYEAPDPFTEGNFEWYERDAKGVEGDLCVIPSGYFAIYERANALMGWQNYMTNLVTKPKMVNSLMEKITDYRIKLAKVKADLGYKIVHIGDDLGMQDGGFFSPKSFKNVLLPHYKKIFEEHKKYGQFIMMHSCGYMLDYLPDLIDAGLDGWEPVQPCNDLRFIKKEYGNHLVFMGGIDEARMGQMNPQQIRDMTKETMEILGKGGGYIIAPSQEVMSDVPIENVVAFLETAVELRDKVM